MSSSMVSDYDEEASGAGLIVGALAGFAIGGPIGAIIGAVLFSSSDSSNSYSRSNSSYSYDYEAQRRRERERRREEEQRVRRARERQKRIEAEQERKKREQEQERQRQIEAERQKKREEERRRMIAQTWTKLRSELKKQIDTVQNTSERSKLTASMEKLNQSYIQALTDGNTSKAENLVSSMRQEIIAVRDMEQIVRQRQHQLSDTLSALKAKSPQGFRKEIDAIIKKSTLSGSQNIEKQNSNIRELSEQTRKLAEEISQVSLISLEGFTEETFFIPPVVDEKAKQDKENERIRLIQDICDFGGRVDFYDAGSAEKLKFLIIEAKNGADISRLKLIRSQVKSTYNRLREQAVMTDMFKQDIRNFLPSMKKAKNTETLCTRMEELLTASVISRDEYNNVYKAVIRVIEEQVEYIKTAAFAEKIGETLTGMGYTLMDENGNPINLTPDTVHSIDTPYEGYRVRVKVGQDNRIVTRLIRVVGSEEEKASTSEYQRQQDIEIGKKCCHDLQSFYSKLEDDGIHTQEILRKEPEDEPLDIVVDTSLKKQRRSSSAQQQKEQLHERSFS